MFQKILNKIGVDIHLGVKCNVCQHKPIAGPRFKCAQCPEFNLCEKCKAKDNHNFHTFYLIAKPGGPMVIMPSPTPQLVIPSIPTHTGVMCSGCGTSPIMGNRYKCTQCPSIDICQNCQSKNIHGFHQFCLIATPGAQPVMIGPQVISQQPSFQPQKVHYSIKCNGCGMFPLLGERYKCSICPNYDLCEKCAISNMHPMHKMVNIN